MSAKRTFARAWSRARGLGDGWIVNLEPSRNLGLGAVGVLTDGEFQSETTLRNRGVRGLETDVDEQGRGQPWSFQTDRDIRVDVAVGANIVGTESSSCELSVSFGQQSGVSIHGSGMWWNRYSDLGLVRAAIVAAARESTLHPGEAIVVAQQVTGAGIVFSSEGGSSLIHLSGNFEVPADPFPDVALMASRLRVVRSNGHVHAQSFSDGSVLAARLLYLGFRGWFWWRELTAFGALSRSPEQLEATILEPTEGSGEHQYFALL